MRWGGELGYLWGCGGGSYGERRSPYEFVLEYWGESMDQIGRIVVCISYKTACIYWVALEIAGEKARRKVGFSMKHSGLYMKELEFLNQLVHGIIVDEGKGRREPNSLLCRACVPEAVKF